VNDVGTFLRHPTLAGLPPLVRKQRTLANKIGPLEPLAEEEKQLRKEIDALLVQAGLAKGESVTCNGYDVTHRERKGQESINQTTLVLALVAAGLTSEAAIVAIASSLETGDPSAWAEVKPSKGASVRKRS
jgi:hypothetical protein